MNMKYLIGFIMTILWIMGVVLAKGFWMTTFTLIPFYAWYVSVEKIMYVTGFIT